MWTVDPLPLVLQLNAICKVWYKENGSYVLHEDIEDHELNSDFFTLKLDGRFKKVEPHVRKNKPSAASVAQFYIHI